MIHFLFYFSFSFNMEFDILLKCLIREMRLRSVNGCFCIAGNRYTSLFFLILFYFILL